MEEDMKGHLSSEFGRTSEVVNVKDSIQGNNGTPECEIFLASPSVSKAVFGTVSKNDVNTSRGEEENQTKMFENASFNDCKQSITSESEEKHVQNADDSKTACEDIMHSKTDQLDMLEVSRGESRDDEGLEVAADGKETAEIPEHDKPDGVSLESKVQKNLTEFLHVTGDETENSSLEKLRDTESVHTLLSAASSEEGRNGLKEKGNMDDNKEEVTLQEKNVPVVDWNDKTDNDIPCNTNNDDNENLAVEEKPEESEADEKLEEPAVEEMLEEPISETKSDRPAANEIFEEPAVQEQPKEPLVEKIVKEPAVEEKLEEQPDEEKLEEPTAEEKLETPATEEKCEEPEPSIHKLVSANSSEDILGALKGKEKTDSTEEEVTLPEKKGKDNTDSTEEEVTLLEKIDREIPYNTNTGIAENLTTEEKTERSAIEEKQSAVEEKLEEPTAVEKEQAIEEKQEKAAVDQKYEEPAIEELQEESEVEENPEGLVIEEPAVEEKHEKSAAEEKLEEPASQEKHEAPAIEEKSEELAAAGKLEEPATSVHTVVSTTSSENILGGLKGKGNTDGIQEKSMPTVVLPNKTENEIPCNANTNVAENLTVKEKLEEPLVKEKSEELTVEKPCAEGHSEERAIEERTASVSELVSTTSSEDILVDLKEKVYRDEIKESLLEKNTPVVDSNDKIDSEIPCNTNNDVAEKSKNEEKYKESAIANFEESAVEESKVENLEERAIEETLDEQASKERSKEPAVEEVLEEPAVEAKFEEPKAEEKSEEPAVEYILGDMNEKDNVGDIKEEMTLLEKNMPTVDLFNKTDSEIIRNANNHEEPAVEEKLEELFERTTAEEQFEEPTVAEKLEDPAVEENPVESAVEKIEEPAGEETLEEPANSARKLVSATVSEETLDGLKGKSNTDDTKEEETLLEKNMPVVDSNDKIGNEINTINDTANNPAIEEKKEEPAEPTVEETLVEPKVENQFEEPEVEENPEEPTVKEKLEEQAIEEKAEGPGVEENLEKTAIDEKIEEPATSVDKLVSTMSSEDILGGMRENDSMNDIMEEITPTVKSSHKTAEPSVEEQTNDVPNNPSIEEKTEELAVEKSEETAEPSVENFIEPKVENKFEEPPVGKTHEEPKIEEPAVEEPATEEELEGPTVEEKPEKTAVEEKIEESATTVDKLVSTKSSEDILDGMKGNNNMDDINEEVILLEKVMPTVELSNKTDREIQCNPNNNVVEIPTVEEKQEKSALEDKLEEPVVEEKRKGLAAEEQTVEEKLEEPEVEERPEGSAAEEHSEEPAAAEKIEELAFQDKFEKPEVAKKIEEPVAEEKLEEPANSAHKLVSVTGSEETLDGLKGNSNTGETKEELTLLEKNMPVVDLNGKIGSEINTKDDTANNPAIEETPEELAIQEKSEELTIEAVLIEPNVENKFEEPPVGKNPEELTVEEKHEEAEVEEKLEEPATTVNKLVSVASSENILGGMKGNDNMDNITVEVTLLKKIIPTVDLSNETDNENPVAEEKLEQPVVENKSEAPATIEESEEPAVEQKFEPAVGEKSEEPAVEENLEEPAVKEQELGVEEKNEEPAVEEKHGEPAPPTNKLVSFTSSEEMLDGFKGESNMDGIKEELTLLEKNMSFVNSNDESGSEINTNNDVTNSSTVEENPEQPAVEEKSERPAKREVEEKLKEPNLENKSEDPPIEENSEEPEVEEKPEEIAVKEKLEEPAVEEKVEGRSAEETPEESAVEEKIEEAETPIVKLVSVTSSEDILGSMKENDSMDDIIEENMQAVDLSNKIDSEISCNTDNNISENPTVEEKQEEPAVEEKLEEPVVEEKTEGPATEEQSKEPAVVEIFEPAAEEKSEEPEIKEQEPGVEEKVEPAVKEELEEPAKSAHKLVTVTSSEEILDGFDGKSNMEEVTLLEKNTLVVDSSDEIDSKINTNNDAANNLTVEEKPEEPNVEALIVEQKPEEPAAEEKLEEPSVGKPEGLAVEEKPEEQAVEEKNEEPAAPVIKLVSIVSSEHIIAGMKENDSMDDITEEVTLLEKNMPTIDLSNKTKSVISCNMNNNVAENSTLEEKQDEPALEEPTVEEKPEEPATEGQSKEPIVAEKFESAVKEKSEEPAVEEPAVEEPAFKEREPGVEESFEEPAVEEKLEEPATPAHKLDSVTSSDKMLDRFQGKSNMEEVTLLDKNMPVVDPSDEIGSEVNTNNDAANNPTVEEKSEEPSVEEKPGGPPEPAVEEKFPEPKVENKPEELEVKEPTVEEKSKEPTEGNPEEPAVEKPEEPADEEKTEEPIEQEVKEKLEEPVAEEKLEKQTIDERELAVEEKFEGPAASVHKLVSATISEDIHDGLEGKGKMDDIKEKTILVENNTPVVDSNDKTGGEIPSIEEKPEKQNREATDEGSEIVAEATRTAEIPKDNKAHGIFSENKVEKNLTELLHVTSDEYESSSFGELTKPSFVHKLDSATPSEAIPDSWNGNGDNGGIKEEVTITSIVQKNKDNSIIPEGEADDLNRQDAHTTQEASERTTSEVNTNQSRAKENENFQQASLNTEEAKDTHGTENLLALSSEEMRVEDSTEKAQDGDKKLLSANKDDFTEPIQETRDLNSEQEASLTEKIVEEDMKKDNTLEATEVDSLNIEKDLDQTSDKGIAEHLEISSEGKKEEQRALEYVEVKPSKDLTVDRIADPPTSLKNILEVVTAEASEDTVQNSNMDGEDLINNEHGQGKTLAVVPKEGLTYGKISDPPSTEIEKSLDSKTEVPQDKEILILEDSKLKKEYSEVNVTASVLKEREIKMIEENLEATGAETKSFQAVTNMSEQIDTEEISYSSSGKKLKQEEEDLNLEMDGVNTTGITDSKEVESSDIGFQNHNKDIIAVDNLEPQSREIDIGHIIDTPVEKETNGRNNEKIPEATEEELIHHTTKICEEEKNINDKSTEEGVSCMDRLEEENTLSSNQEKLKQEKSPEVKTVGNITTKEIESTEIVSSSHEEEREKPREEMDNSEEQLIRQRAEICYSDPETDSLQNSVDPDKTCYAPFHSSNGEKLDIDKEQEKSPTREVDNKLDMEFDRKKDVKMQGLSVPKDDEITYSSGTDTADNKQEQVEASLLGIEKVEAGPEESVKECISNEIVEEKKMEDGTRETSLNATPEATDREESSTIRQFEEIKENSEKEETATYPELNPIVRSTECIETDERIDNLPLPLHFKDSDLVMTRIESLTTEEAHITTEAIREQEKGAIATGDIEIPEVPTAATGQLEIDETKAEDFSKDLEVSEGLVYQGRNFPDDCKEIIENSKSSRLVKITPAFKNHENDSAEKVAPKDQEDSDASDTVSCQKLKEEAAEQLSAPEKSEEQEEDLRESSGKDSSDNKTTQVHQELQATSSEPERGRLEPFGSEQKNKQVECDSKDGPEESRSRESQAEEFEDEEEQTDKEKGNDKGEKGPQETREESSSESPVIVEVSRDADIKVSPKKHQNILSGVGSKVKHSIAKVKKAITGKSSQTKPPSPK